MIEHQLAAVPAGEADHDRAEYRQHQAMRQDRYGIGQTQAQLAPAIATSVIAAIACDQLASCKRMPRTSRSSPVPTMLAPTPVQNAVPADQMPVRSQNASPDHQ